MNLNEIEEGDQRRFHSKFVPGAIDECWTWKGTLNRDGYGHLKIKGHMVGAHRLSFALHKGRIASGLVVRHSCDNPPCVNPAHLSLGTQRDNVLDAVVRGRWSNKTPPAIVEAIRASTASQRSIAAKFGISQSMVSMIKLGKRRSIA